MYNVGKIKYLVNFHDGINKHKDGSEFFDMSIFKSKKELHKFIAYLKENNYQSC